MFSMAVAAMRRRRIAAASALAAALIAPGAAAAAVAGTSSAAASAAAAANLCLRMAETAILNMSVFLLRVLVRHKGPGRVLRTPAGTALASR